MKLSLVIPTYNEKENIQKLLSKLKEEFDETKIKAEIIVVDDNSPDGTGQVLEKLKTKYRNLKIIHREGKSGLSSAVLEGFKMSEGDILGVMDADLSHPAEKINEMYQMIIQGADLVIGSRYVKGGEIKGWNLDRKLLSSGATFLARAFVNVKDPMSGFFMVRKEFIVNKEINPKGFKILLELLVKINFRNIIEIPITFSNRTTGESKAGIKEIIHFLRNLIGYLSYKKEIILQFFKFALVGLVGTLLNVSILYALTEYFKIYYIISALLAFTIAMTTNFIFNKIWTFEENMYEETAKKYLNFFLVSLSALFIDIFFLYVFTEFLGIYYIISQMMAIGISLMINFIGNKIWTFHE
ncbi:MAG: glycosyltransferase family 2 protein [Patescibacteria group bacterium]